MKENINLRCNFQRIWDAQIYREPASAADALLLWKFCSMPGKKCDRCKGEGNSPSPVEWVSSYSILSAAKDWMPPDTRWVKMIATLLLLQLGWWRKNLSPSPYGRKRPCFTTQQSFCEGVRPSFLPESSLALNKGGNFFFSKMPDFLFKMHYGFRQQNDKLEKCELDPEQK